jgi:hypothetical protein
MWFLRRMTDCAACICRLKWGLAPRIGVVITAITALEIGSVKCSRSGKERLNWTGHPFYAYNDLVAIDAVSTVYTKKSSSETER